VRRIADKNELLVWARWKNSEAWNAREVGQVRSWCLRKILESEDSSVADPGFNSPRHPKIKGQLQLEQLAFAIFDSDVICGEPAGFIPAGHSPPFARAFDATRPIKGRPRFRRH
jgi:hypothetical protein